MPYHKDGVAYLPVLPRITLLIVGGGHVGLAVARLASDVDFDIWILDDRETYASGERFPMAERRLVGEYGINRYGEPHEIGWLVAYLCSSRAGFIHSSIIDVDGGMTKAL